MGFDALVKHSSEPAFSSRLCHLQVSYLMRCWISTTMMTPVNMKILISNKMKTKSVKMKGKMAVKESRMKRRRKGGTTI